jgi:hypothetical protein
MPITDTDERLHPVEHADEHWSDSLYFNGFDPKTGACFLTRMGVLANQQTANVLFLAWADGAPCYAYYRGLDHMPPWDWDVATLEGIAYRMTEAQRGWTVTLDDGDNRAYLEFSGFSPCFDYRDNVAPVPRAVAWGHYEQSGTVTGDLVVGDRTIGFDGVGQRDHSWGFRQWDGVREWHWVTGLFGDARSFNLFHVVDASGGVTASGYVYDAGTVHPIVRADRRTREGDDRCPESYELTLEASTGAAFEVVAERCATSVPLRPGTTTIQEAPMRLVSGGLEGLGIYELLFNGRGAAG